MSKGADADGFVSAERTQATRVAWLASAARHGWIRGGDASAPQAIYEAMGFKPFVPAAAFETGGAAAL